MSKFSFQLDGMTAFLMHHDDVAASDRLRDWRKDPGNKGISTPGDDRSPAWTWQTYVYHDGKNIVVPSSNIMVCLRQAGAQMILKKQKTFKEVSQSGMFIEQEFCEFRCGESLQQVPIDIIAAMADKTYDQQAADVQRLGFRLWAKRAKIGTAKNVRVRPRFEHWQVRGTVQVVAPELTRQVLEQLFEIAGRAGLGDWRPGCKTPGSFGMFRATVE